MKVTQEKLPDSQLGLEIEISGETSQKKYDEVVKQLTSSTNIPGFRKGKVPKQILIQRLGAERIKAAVLEELLQESIKEAIDQTKINCLGQYKLQSKFEDLLQAYKPGQTLTFTAAVEVPPEVKLEEYRQLEIKAEETVYDPEEVEKFLEEKRAAKPTLIPVEDRPAQIGDLAVIDYAGREPASEGESELGSVISDVEGKDFEMELDVAKFIPGFVDGIVGMNIGETKNVPLTFPEDYPKEDVAGKDVVFVITLKELKEKELPELDDDFAQEVSEFETLAELRESLVKQFQEKANSETENAINEAIISELVAKNTIPLPESLVEEEVNQMLTQTAMQFQQMGVDIKQLFTPDSIPQMRQNIRPEAENKIKERLIIQEIAKQESLTPEEEAIASRATEIRKQLEGKDVDEERLQSLVVEELTKEKTLTWLREQSNVELVPKGSLSEDTEGSEEAADTPETPEIES